MATPAQIADNRLNAQHSTGPRSVEGKTASCYNALKLGLDAQSLVIPGEDPTALEALFAGYHEQFHAANPVEAFLVNSLVQYDWIKRRLAALEANAIRAMFAVDQLHDRPNPLGVAVMLDAQGANLLEKISRRLAAQDRAYLRALAELRKLQAESQPPEHHEAADAGLPLTTSPAAPSAVAHLHATRPASAGLKNWVRSQSSPEPHSIAPVCAAPVQLPASIDVQSDDRALRL